VLPVGVNCFCQVQMQQQLLHPNPLFIAGFLASALVATFTNWKITRDVNVRLPNDQKFMWVAGWGPFMKGARLLKRHKEMYPVSRLRLYFVASYAVGVVLSLLVVYSAIPKK